MTPATFNRIFNRTDAQCLRCGLGGGDLIHMLWACHKLTTYWEIITTHLAQCTDRTLQWNWEICLLGLYRRQKKHKVTNRFIDLGLIVAKRLITKRWKAPDPPPARAWYHSMICWAQAESVALQRQDAIGIRKTPLAVAWEPYS